MSIGRRNLSRKPRNHRRGLRIESLEKRQMMAGDLGSLHNAAMPSDVNGDGDVTPIDALNVINYLSRLSSPEGEFGAPASADDGIKMVDVDNSGNVTALDALLVVNDLLIEGEDPPLKPSELNVNSFFDAFPKAAEVDSVFAANFNNAFEVGGSENELQAADVDTLLSRASAATRSNDGIIAVVDRNGTILGVRVEEGVYASLPKGSKELSFAIDGAVAKARTAAFFSSGQAPLTSRTIRSLSQSTMTQREVQSSPVAEQGEYQGPGFVAPIGVGGKFPPEVNFTPQVDLFAIEHQSRDSQLHAGTNQIKGDADDFTLRTRFNGDPTYIPESAEDFFQTWPESYGVQTETDFAAQSRGVATLPGGIPLFKTVVDSFGNAVTSPVSDSINLVGGIGVFFPGEDGFASYEQGFVRGINQSEKTRTNADKVLEAEFAAFIAAAGQRIVVGDSNFSRDLREFNQNLPELERFVLPNGRIDLVGITLEIYGPNPTREHRIPGIDRLIEIGRANFGGNGFVSGELQVVSPGGDLLLDGRPVPEGWLIAPHDSQVDLGLTSEIVDQIINQGIREAEITRAAIRLDIDNQFRPGARTAMVMAVTDSTGELLGLYRMPDATVFSIDVAIAKARNVVYYADATAGVLQDADRIDFNGDGVFGTISTSLSNNAGDTLPVGTAVTNRTFRFLAEPRYPTGQELPANSADGLNKVDPLCEQKPEICRLIAPQSILRLPGINPITAENLGDGIPLDISVYRDPNSPAVLAYDAFNIGRNFRDLGDAEVKIHGTEILQPLANQNGIVFFPGSTPVYLDNDAEKLVGGFGVSGDGVDQDDVVTSAGQVGYAAPASIRADQFPVAGVRLPFQKFNRDPRG
ncbi:hypothetical protein K227x_28450 [Rubripirellula lacrimiformis]|uniref:Planctomycete extracellular domain-containing protein n=1 Tax=Rubripirellula lacrimiformis TaxID=1930273 RepID=A0A517NBE3_9BACT|nr:heme-binding protein [Rubripirellula lacrimiformis]QDT04454.1 hypothetical protein K227x_28450 [Rubripirellula lacrimiformis]